MARSVVDGVPEPELLDFLSARDSIALAMCSRGTFDLASASSLWRVLWTRRFGDAPPPCPPSPCHSPHGRSSSSSDAGDARDSTAGADSLRARYLLRAHVRTLEERFGRAEDAARRALEEETARHRRVLALRLALRRAEAARRAEVSSALAEAEQHWRSLDEERRQHALERRLDERRTRQRRLDADGDETVGDEATTSATGALNDDVEAGEEAAPSHWPGKKEDGQLEEEESDLDQADRRVIEENLSAVCVVA